MTKERKSPKLRFKGFTNDWKPHKLGDITLSLDKQRIPIKSMNRKKGKYPYYGATGIVDYVNDYIFQGTYLLLAEDGANIIDRTLPLVYKTSGKFWLNNHAHILKPLHQNVDFLLNLLEKQNYTPYNTGTAQPKLNGQVVGKIILYTPTLSEENKIGRILLRINDIIALQQHKLDLLKKVKKGFLQNLFPAENSSVPRIRFAEFNSQWKREKLGDLVSIKTGSRNLQDAVENGKYPFFVRSDKVARLNEYDFDEKAILIPGDGRIGEIFHYYDGKFALHQRVYKVSNFKLIQPLFLLFMFQQKFKKHALRLNVQGTVPSLRLPMFTEWRILVPSTHEQQKIGHFVQKLDQQIKLQQFKIKKIKQIKKFLLQNMFI